MVLILVRKTGIETCLIKLNSLADDIFYLQTSLTPTTNDQVSNKQIMCYQSMLEMNLSYYHKKTLAAYLQSFSRFSKSFDYIVDCR